MWYDLISFKRRDSLTPPQTDRHSLFTPLSVRYLPVAQHYINRCLSPIEAVRVTAATENSGRGPVFSPDIERKVPCPIFVARAPETRCIRYSVVRGCKGAGLFRGKRDHIVVGTLALLG